MAKQKIAKKKNEESKDRQVSIRLSSEDYEALEHWADVGNDTVSGVVREAVNEYIVEIDEKLRAIALKRYLRGLASEEEYLEHVGDPPDEDLKRARARFIEIEYLDKK